MTQYNWVLAHEYGQGCKVYADMNSLVLNGNIARVTIKHHLVPPGTDKRNQKAVQEISFDKEFDFERKKSRYHSITFTYTDGVVADPLQAEPKWLEVDQGSLAELNFLHSAALPKKRKTWWPF